MFVANPDHCPPHVHCENADAGWMARIKFSFVNNDLELWDVVGSGKKPRLAALNVTRAAVLAALKKGLMSFQHHCRDEWWRLHAQTCGACLANKWVEPKGRMLVLSRRRRGALARCVGGARYDPLRAQTTVWFKDRGGALIQL